MLIYSRKFRFFAIARLVLSSLATFFNNLLIDAIGARQRRSPLPVHLYVFS